jgi:monoamine oxidase
LVRLTTTVSLPTGLSTSTDYYVINTGANTFSLASSLANANLATPLAKSVSAQGTGTDTYTPTAISQVAKLQQSNDGVTFFDVSGKSTTITATGNDLWIVTAPPAYYHKVVVTPTAGALTLAVITCARDNSYIRS